MIRILALDTTSWWGGVALVETRRENETPETVFSLGAQVHGSHATHLLRWIDSVLGMAGWSPSGLDGFVATIGPGSFTGVRIGLGTIRGLALAADRPCAGVSTLDAIAEASGPAPIDRVSVIGAGRGEAYGARYPAHGHAAEPTDGPWLGDPQRFLSTEEETVLIPGPGSESWLRSIAGRASIRVAAAPTGVAAAAGRIALARDALGEAAAAGLAPLYLRPPDAELRPRSR